MHFVDDWEAGIDTEWEKYFLYTKVELKNSTATYQAKFDMWLKTDSTRDSKKYLTLVKLLDGVMRV